MRQLLAQVGQNFETQYEGLTRLGVEILPAALSALIVFTVFWFFYRVTRKMLHAALRRSKIEPALSVLLIDNIYHFAVLGVGIVMAADQIGINIAAALAGIGVIGVAVGFAAQDTLNNIIAGFLILWDKPFRVRDWITVDHKYGEVVEITLRSTRIRTLDNTYVVVPNKSVLNATLINHSKNGEMRVNIPLSIAYKEDIASARKVLLEAVTRISGVLKDPKPSAVVVELGDSGVHLLVLAWIADAREEKRVFYEGLEASKQALDQAGIEIPFPHMQLFVDEIKDQPAAVLGRRLPQGD